MKGKEELATFLTSITGKVPVQLRKAIKTLRSCNLSYTKFARALDAGMLGNSGWAGFSRVVGTDIQAFGPEKARRVMMYINRFIEEEICAFKEDDDKKGMFIEDIESVIRLIIKLLLEDTNPKTLQELKHSTEPNTFMLKFRLSYDKRNCGTIVYLVPLHFRFPSQHWRSVIALHLIDGNESEISSRCFRIANFVAKFAHFKNFLEV
jgi:hypothetical protein